MYGDKVHNDADVVLMAGIDELHQFLGGSVPGGRTVESGILVSPGFIARVLA